MEWHWLVILKGRRSRECRDRRCCWPELLLLRFPRRGRRRNRPADTKRPTIKCGRMSTWTKWPSTWPCRQSCVKNVNPKLINPKELITFGCIVWITHLVTVTTGMVGNCQPDNNEESRAEKRWGSAKWLRMASADDRIPSASNDDSITSTAAGWRRPTTGMTQTPACTSPSSPSDSSGTCSTADGSTLSRP